ncbi:MAG: hypothetical protein ACE14O_03805 [Candidatus Cloacimonadaceae bacterium]
MKMRFNWKNIGQNLIWAIILAAGVLILWDNLGKMPTIGILLIALALQLARRMERPGILLNEKKDKEDQ